MNVHTIPDRPLGNTSYLVEVGDGCAVSVDPRRDVDEHLALASMLDLRIVSVLETHLHADFVSGAREIAAVTGAEIVGAEAAGLRFEHRGVTAGERIRFGSASIEVIATPGHTPEHVAYLVGDGEQRGVFSGGSLIVGGAARTDLTGPDRTDELSRAQYASLRTLASLPDDVALYPTHGAGSFCSTGAARSAVSTIGDERKTNPLLGLGSVEAFVDALRQGFAGYPRYFDHLRELNRNGVELLASLPASRELSAVDAHDAAAAGAWIIDARSVHQWARAHATGSVSIELRPAFASWLGWVVPFGAPIVLVLEPEQLGEAVSLARRIGYDAIEGWIRFEMWREARLAVSSIAEIDPVDAPARVDAGALMLDVRRSDEFTSGHIAGAAHLELGDIIAGETPDGDEIITYCGHGERSATAASLLARRGMAVANLRGGSGAWRAAGLPLEL